MLENHQVVQQQSSFTSRLPTALPQLDQADLLVAYLEQIGVEYVFGVPGGAIEPLYNAIGRNLRNGGQLSPVIARHEAGATYMADGYTRETGKIGVCVATSGPGATNMLTAVANAYSNGIPMLVITGQPALPSFGKYTLQESSCTGIDVIAMFRHCTRYNSLVSHPGQLECKLTTALQHATRCPAGPAHLSIPLDVLRSASTGKSPAYDMNSLLRPSGMIDHDAVAVLQRMLALARKPALLIGGGCGGSVHSILQFASMTGTVLVTTPDAKGLISPQHPLYRGVFGFAGHASAEAALNDPAVDIILAVGTSAGEWDTGSWNTSLLNNRLVHIDESEEHLARTPMARHHVRGRISVIFEHLHTYIFNRPDGLSGKATSQCTTTGQGRQFMETLDAPDAYLSDAIPLKPARLMKELGDLFPHSTRFLADAGNSIAWAVHYLQPNDRRMGERRVGNGDRPRTLGKRQSPGGWLRLTSNFAPMGWAIGAAIGTAAANPHVPVVCITGDGSFLMNGQELSVAVAEQQCVIFIVLNDRALGMVKHGQRLAGAEPIGYALPPTDFAAMARAQGGVGYTIRSVLDLHALDIKAICNHPGPTLLDVLIDPEEVPPMAKRVQVLQGER